MNYYSYISTKAAWDCIQTIFLCVPGKYAKDAGSAEQYARESGWVQTAEDSAAVLVVPVTENWQETDVSWIPDFYDKHKNDFRAPGGVSIPGRDGTLWLWETMIYLVGYEDGADYAAKVLTAHPGFFAGSLIANGQIRSYENADAEASHWFVRTPTDYHRTNRQIPSAVWLAKVFDEKTVSYFKTTACADSVKEENYGSVRTTVSYCSANPAQEVRISYEIPDAETVMDTFFEHTLRWKNSPDGELRNYIGKKDWPDTERFAHYSVSTDGQNYPYSVYLPEGMTRENMPELPLVFSIHGRGEPAWVFAEKNGWQALADETKEFMAVFPDSPYNIWQIGRDRTAVKAMLEDICKNYRVDCTRVYLTGFSNGAIFTCQQASTFPELFAAASPWNGPGIEACRKMGIDDYVYEEHFKDSGYEMPMMIFVGDSDGKASSYREDELDILLKANHCSRDTEKILGEEYYTAEKGYTQGDRFYTRVFRDENNVVKTGLTVMKNMPHGAIWDESRAAWNFLKQFRRTDRNKQAEVVERELV
ncbi:MAG: hypothetical protein IJJ29_06255 [Solobacterium sp.]|nr:hypothetical protein [Solobacterium sp.]